MTRNRDIKELERKIAYHEGTITQNARDIDIYTASISQSRYLIDDLESDIATERIEMEDNYVELNALKIVDIEDKEHLDVLRGTLDVMKNGLPDTGKAFTNPRHKSEKMISFFSGGSP